MPWRWSRWASISPAGPAPTMPTCVRTPTRLDWWWWADGRGTQDLRPRFGDTYVVCARSRDAPAARLRAVQVDRTAPPEAAADLPAAEHYRDHRPAAWSRTCQER